MYSPAKGLPEINRVPYANKPKRVKTGRPSKVTYSKQAGRDIIDKQIGKKLNRMFSE